MKHISLSSSTELAHISISVDIEFDEISVGLGLGLGLVTVCGLKTFTLPDLPYDYGALEPYISGEIMQLHHQKHHQTYVINFNNALEHLDQAMAKSHSLTIVKLQSAIKFNGGGRRW